MAQHHNLPGAGPRPLGVRHAQNVARSLSSNPLVRSAHLHANKLGYWEIRWKEPGVRQFRKQSLRTKNRTQAEVEFDQWLTIAAQMPGAGLAMVPTVQEICEAYLRAKPVQGYILKPVIAAFGALPVTALDHDTPHLYQTLRDDMVDGSRRRQLGALKSALYYAQRHRIISEVPLIELPPQSSPRVIFLEENAMQRVWEAAQAWSDPRIGLFVAIALATGARREAILELTWDRINFQHRTINFQVPGRPQTKKRRPDKAPMSDRLHEVLVKACGRSTLGRLIDMPTRTFTLMFHRFRMAIDMPALTPHQFRHTFATLLLRKGHSIVAVATLLADTPVTVQKTYAHVTPSDFRHVVNDLF